MKMTDETEEFDTEFLYDFLDEILNSDFIDDVINNASDNEVAECVEQTTEILNVNNNRPEKQDAGVAESIQCRKRRLRNDETEQSKERRPSVSSKSPTIDIDILKRAVERIKNAKKTVDSTSDGTGGTDTNDSGTSSGSNDYKDNETRQKINGIDHNGTVQSSQIDDQPHLQQIVRDILQGLKVMVIMRGPPGCGKSYLAREIIDRTTRDCHSDHIFSSCNFFYNQNGCFDFNPMDVGRSHEWNQEFVVSHACNGWSPIIVDNTNIKKWEMDIYVQIAVRYGYLIELVEPNTPWSKSADALFAMNIHDVPKKTIERMLRNYEWTTVTDLLKGKGLQYTTKMPQYRRLPTLL